MKQDFFKAAALAGLFAIGTMALAPTAAQAAKGKKAITVDDDKQQNKNAAHTTIQAAINAAVPGDTIVVSPGVYTGAAVTKAGLTIKGPRAGEDASDKDKKRVTNTPSATKEAIIIPELVNTGDGFSIEANSVTIDGFFLQGTNNAINTEIGIDTRTFGVSGFNIRNNVIANHFIGIRLVSSGGLASTVSNNAILNNNAPNGGFGIANFNDPVSNVVISKNLIAGNNDTQIFIDGLTGTDFGVFADKNKNKGQIKASANITVTGNSFDATASAQATSGGILVTDVPNVLISDNTFVGGSDAAIILADGVTGSAVSGNKITLNTGDGIAVGNFGIGSGSAPSGNRISGNIIGANGKTMSGVGLDGIYLFDTTNNQILENTVRNSGEDGIDLESADNNAIANNIVSNSGVDGISLDNDSEGNLITKNEALGSNRLNLGGLDLRDESTGSGTAGTANFYSKNKFATSQP